MEIRKYRIASETRGPAYEALIRYCASVGASCSLVDLLPTSKKGRAARDGFLKEAQPDLLRTQMVKRWPLGCVDGGGAVKPVPLWVFALNPPIVELLVRRATGLYGWTSDKGLPEDLAVYRANGTVLLGSVAHEHIGWMSLTPEEAADRRLGLVELR